MSDNTSNKLTDLRYNQETQVLVGEKKRTLIDQESGEVILVDQITKRVYGTKMFWKVYLMDFLMVLGIIDSKQLDVFLFIVENTSAENNVFLGTYREISHKVGVSQPTIARIMKKLQENGFIKKKQNGAWFVNPNILMKGNDHKRQILLSYFEDTNGYNTVSFTRHRQEEIKIPFAEQQALPFDDEGTLPPHTPPGTISTEKE